MVNKSTESIATTQRLILASDSPRRRELVGALDLPLELASPGGEEGAPRESESARQFALRLSMEKAGRVAAEAGDAVVLGADTVVVLDATVLGKPTDAGDAVQMLRKLRSRAHSVVTGVTALDVESGRRVSASKATEVIMRDYSNDEVAYYVASGEPSDKAGAYAVQGLSVPTGERGLRMLPQRRGAADVRGRQSPEAPRDGAEAQNRVATSR